MKESDCGNNVEKVEENNDNSILELPSLEFCKSSTLGNRLSRSRSGSPANFDKRPFEKEKSPFLQVKQLLKPVKKAAVAIEPEWKKVGKQLKPRIAPLALQPASKIKNQVKKKCTPGFSKGVKQIIFTNNFIFDLKGRILCT